ncbi:gluconate 2-dehydrogenase subunit 3 family protein [Spirosoma sp. BT702]|uniref:Gluconate 2-dehydrogenase subunit 3 family protein n=1 Tax=Spirosoma profusum TaxID=2771354 RepID=A0A926XX28_9BACT|nr:gluconate 2-dehydrogenase subunit 3 family protein [Spirosoma profusum]MBD2702454.1 gluconate 2-dehydrogenase subunit 3 family protein [Spirosoma profusum]
MEIAYPVGTVRALMATDQVTDATRRALTERLTTETQPPQFFSNYELNLLRTICDRLIPQSEHHRAIDVAGGIDSRLAQGKSDGWRYDDMPIDEDTYQLGLAGIDEAAQKLFGQPFQQLSDTYQDQVLRAVQQAKAPGESWKKLRADRFFEELLAESTYHYYSHPLAQEEIGYVGMADVPGWQRIGLDQREEREPERSK